MKRITGIAMVLLMLMSVTIAFADNTKDTQTDRKKVIIGFVDRPNQADENMIHGHGGKTKYTYNIIYAKAVEIPEQAIDRIKKNPRVKYVEEDAEVHALGELDDSWGVDRIDADEVWSSNTGLGVKVAIIDTGIDYNHDDLDGNYAGGYDYVNDDDNPMDDAGHGTHCAGIVAAEKNGEGVVGVAPNANLYAVKVLDETGSGFISDVVAGIEWAVEHNMDVISMSLGGPSSDTLKAACGNAYDEGLVLVASAGNSGTPRGRTTTTVGYPAAYASVIAVSATDSSDVIAYFSSRGPEVEIAAPGVNIYSTYLNNAYTAMSGTSMACPHVAGTAALVIASEPSLTNIEVRERLQNTAEDKGPDGWDSGYGWGIVDAYAALQFESGPNQAPVADAGPGQSVSVNETVTFNGYGSSDPDGTIVSYEWDFGDGATGTGQTVNHDYLTVGNYTVILIVTDDGGANDSDTALVTVTEEPTTEEPTYLMHIDNITMALDSRIAGRNVFTWALATVTVVDSTGYPVPGAEVRGSWSGLTSDSDTGATDADENVTAQSDRVKNPSGTFTFAVTDILLTDWEYNATANVVNSGSITV